MGEAGDIFGAQAAQSVCPSARAAFWQLRLCLGLCCTDPGGSPDIAALGVGVFSVFIWICLVVAFLSS